MVTVCLTYFKSLALANFAAALYSVRQQDLSRVRSLVVVDNDTTDSWRDILGTIEAFDFPVPVSVLSSKHGDPSKTHSWSTNVAVRAARAPWVLFTRADYILHFDLVRKFVDVVDAKPAAWEGFVTGNVYHLNADVGECERTTWRQAGPGVLRALAGGVEEGHTCIDAGVWMMRRASFDLVGGLDEGLTAWGHAQTHFQYKLHEIGVECVRIPEALFYHPMHAAPRDMTLAHRQLEGRGIDVKELWARYEGTKVYQ